jgi:dGTPase
MMNWSQLFSARRTGDPEHKHANPDQMRTSYMRDYDRIIFSSAFRRLQNKTQVFPLPGAVFVHNRLTHSLEVASVGRSLGRTVGEAIALRYPEHSEAVNEFYRHELASVIASACLAHDIGNPPFGHSGEDAIRAYFTRLQGPMREQLHAALSPNQLMDFEKFEGNSNAFRTLTHSFNEPQLGGYRLTYTTLASIVKYPCTSQKGFNKALGIHAKKSGYFDSEQETYYAIARTLGIPQRADGLYARHPFVYLVEAADDICYRVIDLEDAHRLHIISLETFKELLLPFFEREAGYNDIAYINGKLDAIVDPNQQAQYIRAMWIGLMTRKLSQIFMDQEAALLAGTLDKDLLSCLPEYECSLIKKINDFSYSKIYNHKSVVEIEITGFQVIGRLLEEFVYAVLNSHEAKSDKLLQLIPDQFPIKKGVPDKLYANIQSVVDYIAGMTDLFAMDLYRKINGIDVTKF